MSAPKTSPWQRMTAGVERHKRLLMPDNAMLTIERHKSGMGWSSWHFSVEGKQGHRMRGHGYKSRRDVQRAAEMAAEQLEALLQAFERQP